jgi:putative sterol carrier protein
MTVSEVLGKLPAALDPAAAGDTACTLQFNVSTPAYLVIGGGSAQLQPGTTGDADITITMADDDIVALMTGQLDGMTAFMSGKLQVEGDLFLAQRVLGFFDKSKLR